MMSSQFQRTRTQEQFDVRREEILNACAEIYKLKSFDEVIFKDIAERTSLSRTTIYSYYKTKEEIFLDLIKREYLFIAKNLSCEFKKFNNLSCEDFCGILADAFMSSDIMLSLFAIQLTRLEAKCSVQQLANFKIEIEFIFDVLQNAVKKFFPNSTNLQRDNFIAEFFIFIQGVYPYTKPSAKQLEAINLASVKHCVILDTREILYDGLLNLAHGLK